MTVTANKINVDASPIAAPFNFPGYSPKTNKPKISSISSSQLPSYSQKADSVAVQAITENNGDLVQTPIREFVYSLLIDAVGGVRQVAAAVAAAAALAGGFIVAGAASVFIPFGLLFTGVLSLDTALAWSIPDAINEFKNAGKEFELVEMDKAHPLRLEAEKNRVIAGLGLANQSLYGSMGVGQIAAGFITIISSPFTHLMNHLFAKTTHVVLAPLLTGAKAATAALATSVALAAIYVVRGIVMMVRAGIKLVDVNDFRNKFNATLQENSKDFQESKIEKAINFMEDAEKRGGSYLNRRVDSTCLQAEINGNKFTYTAEGLKDKNGKIELYDTFTEQDYLNRVDKGIFSEKLKNQIAMIIAGAMIIGGILAIILATVFTGGIASLVIGLTSAVFFISMEYIFLTYDSSRLFKLLRDRLYDEPKWQNESGLRGELDSNEWQGRFGPLVIRGEEAQGSSNSDSD